MRRAGGRVLWPACAWLLTIALLPLVVVVGEPLRRHVLRRRRQGWQRRSFALGLVTTPLWIALTAPARFVLDRAGRLPGPRRWRRPPEAAGVREPRRPRPGPPGQSVALAEPRAEPVMARLLGTVSRRARPGRPGR